MDSERCHILLTVLETGSLSAAAAQLGYTPSGVSRVIAAMESEAGLPLLIRTRDGVRATPECAQLLPSIREMQYWGSYYTEQTRRLRGIETGTVRVGSVYTVFYPWMAELIAGFSELYPGIEIKTIEGTSSEMCSAVEERKGDFCIVSRREGNFRFVPLLKDEAVVMLSTSHPRAKDREIPLKAFEEEPVIELYPNKETDTSHIYEQYHIKPNVRFSTMDLHAGYAMAEAGLGICIENKVTTDRLTNRLVILPLKPRVFIDVGIVIPEKKAISPAAAAFAEYALQRKPEWLS